MSSVDEDERGQILALLSQGLSSRDIGRRLGVSPGRVAAIKAHNTMGTYQGDRLAEDVADLEEVVDAADLKFGLERDMQDALRRNIEQLDPGLRIIDGGTERRVEAGFIDILAEDEEGSLVVIELKSGEAPEGAVTQVLSYIGSLQAIEGDRRVRES